MDQITRSQFEIARLIRALVRLAHLESDENPVVRAARLYENYLADEVRRRHAELVALAKATLKGRRPTFVVHDDPFAPAFAGTDEQIKHMVNRFLTWRLPENFNPDGGISFEKVGNAGTAHAYARQPTGTNLFDGEQAAAMIRHMIEGLPGAKVTEGPEGKPAPSSPNGDKSEGAQADQISRQLFDYLWSQGSSSEPA